VKFAFGEAEDGPPPDVATVTGTVSPAPPAHTAEHAGLSTSISVDETGVMVDIPRNGPNWTSSVPVRLVPVTMTSVPPVVGPDVGEMPVTVGGEASPTVRKFVPEDVPRPHPSDSAQAQADPPL